MKKLPFLISIPHGGDRMPKELAKLACISDVDIFDDIDPFTSDIFDLGAKATEVITTDIARTFVDLNRATDDLPPGNPDGVVKTMTCYGKPIYKTEILEDGIIHQLLKSYYGPYHEKLRNAVTRPDIELALDCHSMAAVGPQISPDKGEQRPLICLGNVHGKSCEYKTVEKLARCFQEAFSIESDDVTINQPFSGGYITRTYGDNPIPWIQVEINRSLYLHSNWFDRKKLTISQVRIDELKAMFEAALLGFFG
jgi:formiminoglutamase